jgi:hypothetical protein
MLDNGLLDQIIRRAAELLRGILTLRKDLLLVLLCY